MKFSEYIQYDGIGLAQLVQNKEVQAHELLEIAIQRAEQVNPKINAIVIPIYEHALKIPKIMRMAPFQVYHFYSKIYIKNMRVSQPHLVLKHLKMLNILLKKTQKSSIAG